MAEPTPLGKYIKDLCKRQGKSMRAASIAAGLGSETIGQIVRRRNTTRPRPETLQAIAWELDGSYRHMMYLAGHEDKPEEEVLIEAAEIAELISSLPPGNARDDLIGYFRVMLAAAHRNAKEQGE